MRETPADSRGADLEPLTLDGSGQLDMRATYGADARHEVARLFEPAPAQLAGQTELFEPDSNQTAGTPADRSGSNATPEPTP